MKRVPNLALALAAVLALASCDKSGESLTTTTTNNQPIVESSGQNGSIGQTGNNNSGNTGTPAPSGTRYATETFSAVDITTNIPYGQSRTQDGTTQSLTLDLYEPQGDDANQRPVVILAPGGDFTGLDMGPMDPLAQKLSKSGYVVAIMRYRTTDSYTVNHTKVGFLKAAMDAMSDQKAAIRFFRQDAAKANEYRINPDKIFIGGHSAGAITALHTAYIGSEEESGNDLFPIISANGGIEGNSGNPGFSSQVAGVINLSGALLDPGFPNAGAAPLLSIHGDADVTINIDQQTKTFSEGGTVSLYGSQSVHQAVQSRGVPSEFVRLPGGSHAAPLNGECPSCAQRVVDFLYRNL